MGELKLTLKDIDDLKTHLETAISSKVEATLSKVEVAVAAFEGRVAAVEGVQRDHATKVGKLEANQAKAIASWTVMIGLVTTGITLIFNELRGRVMNYLHR